MHKLANQTVSQHYTALVAQSAVPTTGQREGPHQALIAFMLYCLINKRFRPASAFKISTFMRVSMLYPSPIMACAKSLAIMGVAAIFNRAYTFRSHSNLRRSGWSGMVRRSQRLAVPHYTPEQSRNNQSSSARGHVKSIEYICWTKSSCASRKFIMDSI